MRPRASVIVPTWNGARFLGPCLSALRAQGFGDHEVLVVDNGSTDDTGAVLAAYPEAEVLWLGANRGFAAACNAGLARARGEVLVLLNNDTEVEPGWLGALVSALEADPAAGMAQPKVRLHAQRDRLHTTGDTLSWAWMPGNRGVWELDRGQWDDQPAVFGANAAAAAYRRAMLEDVGLLEAAFGSYLEDVDLACRGRLRGWTCVYVPQAVVYHHVSATGGGPLASYHVARNRWWLIVRCCPAGLVGRHLGPFLAAQAAAAVDALRHWRGAAARATLRGLVAGALTWPRMLPARRLIQARRTVDDATFEGWLTHG